MLCSRVAPALTLPPAQTPAAPDPAFLAAFADASHQLAMKEAHLVRRQAQDNANASSSSDALAPPLAPGAEGVEGAHAAPVLREPLPAGVSGNSFISYVPFQARLASVCTPALAARNVLAQ